MQYYLDHAGGDKDFEVLLGSTHPNVTGSLIQHGLFASRIGQGLKAGHGSVKDVHDGGLPYLCRMVPAAVPDDYLMSWHEAIDDMKRDKEKPLNTHGIGDVLHDVGYLIGLAPKERVRH